MKKILFVLVSIGICSTACKKEQSIEPAQSKVTFGGGTTKARPTTFQTKVSFGGGIAQ
jgi:hypothetical protein